MICRAQRVVTGFDVVSRAAQEIGNESRVSVAAVLFLTRFLVDSYSNVLLLAWHICLKKSCICATIVLSSKQPECFFKNENAQGMLTYRFVL